MTACTIIKRDALGRDELSYQGVLREICGEYVCIEAEFGFADRDLGYVQLRRGDVFREWFFRDRWFNIFRVSDGRTSNSKDGIAISRAPRNLVPTGSRRRTSVSMSLSIPTGDASARRR